MKIESEREENEKNANFNCFHCWSLIDFILILFFYVRLLQFEKSGIFFGYPKKYATHLLYVYGIVSNSWLLMKTAINLSRLCSELIEQIFIFRQMKMLIIMSKLLHSS